MFLPRFSGNDDDNPTSWIFRAELYFTYLGFDEKHWLPLPSFYLDGEALTWFNWLFRNKLFLDWKHFKDRFAQRFQQQTNRDVLGRLSNSSQVHFDSVNSVPIVSQSAVVPPFPAPSHFPKSSPSASAYDTGSSQAVHVFDELPMKYKYVESVSLITKNNVEVEDTETPRLENANSVEVNLVHEPSPIIEDQVFDEISHTTVSSNIDDLTAIVHDVEHSVTTVAKVYNGSFYNDIKVPLVVLYDMEGSNTDEEKNSQDNVAWFENFPPLNISELLVAFACQVTVMSNASSRLAEIKYPFADTLRLCTIPCWHNSLDEICRGNQNKVFLCLDFRLRKCSWVDTGQECNLSSFLSSNPRGCASEEKIQEVVRLIVAMFGLAHKARLPSPYIVFDPGPYLDYESSYAIYSTFGDRESVEEGAVTVHLKRPEVEFHIGQVLSVQIGFIADDCNQYGTYLYCHIGTCTYSHLEFDVILWVVPFCNSEDNCLDTGQDDFGCVSIANESLNTVSKALQCNTYITFLELQCKELLQHKEMGNSWIHGSTCWISLTMWLAIHYSFSFLAPNLEDKVLIEGGSIVVNRVGSVRAYGLELVKETDLVGIIGPSKMLESFVWDPGPINIWLKGRRSWKEGLCILKKMVVISSPSSRV
ncbi:hypothetical protein KY290_020443 [Solanum tuberosum]|uniref:Uncharacterized protein n=1 Tax=Solanum tuberosum TaxID=4113 RepID=A0ABQ7UYQ0_SOLTU|nr:hypothetical protein KY290_020443 [Solanum tuberosum]